MRITTEQNNVFYRTAVFKHVCKTYDNKKSSGIFISTYVRVKWKSLKIQIQTRLKSVGYIVTFVYIQTPPLTGRLMTSQPRKPLPYLHRY